MDGIVASRIAPSPQPEWVARRRIAVREYHQMTELGILRHDERIELIEGELIAMAAVGGPHIARVIGLNHLFVEHAAGRWMVSVQNPIRLGDYSEPEPDLVLVRPPARRYVAAPPTPPDIFLVIEVADTTLRYDRTVKAALYARHGVAEYWIVDVDAGTVTVHRGPAAEGYAEIRQTDPAEVLEPVSLPGLRLPVATILD